ncbi:MAG: tetratricopeptide repeat protein [Pseudomonadales bacterium]|nr:tetratricopeptide repeat protein [Pseudomonadales bacterium]
MTMNNITASSGENTLDPEYTILHFSGLAQQTGVGLEHPLGTIEGRIRISSQKNLSEIVPDEFLPVIIDTENKLLSLTGISELIKELRKHILELSTLDDKNLIADRNEIKMDVMSNDVINIDPNHSKLLLSEKKTIIHKYISSVARITLLIRAIDSIDEDKKDEYNLIKSQLENWLTILNKILPNLNEDNEINKLIEQEIIKQSNNNFVDFENNEVSRLKKLLSGERAGRDEKKQKKLTARVISVLLGNTDVKKQNEVSKDLSEELWEVASVINDIRLVERFKKEQINLLEIKNQISNIKQEFKSGAKKNNESEEEFADRLNNRILELVIPIVNTTNKLFPHESNKSPSNIAAILYRNEALCSGKAEVISSIMKLIGLESTPINVIQTKNDYHGGHVISKTNLLGKTILFADANFDLAENINPIIQRESTRLLYTAKKVPNNNDSNPNIFKMLRTNGEILFYESDTNAPHKIIADREKGSISFDHNNFALLLEENYQELGLSKHEAMNQAQHHYLEALRINPNDSIAHNNYAILLKQNYQELGLSKQEAMNQAQHHYLEAIRINPNYSIAHNNYAILLQQNYQELGLSKQEAMNQTQHYYLEAIRINPNYSFAHNNYADILEKNYQELGLSKQEAMNQAQHHYLEALRINPNYSTAHSSYAILLQQNYQELGLSKQEAMNQTQHHYKEALRINPNDSITHSNYAILLKENYQELGLSKQKAMNQASYHYQEALKDKNNKYYLWIMTLYADFLLNFVGDKQSALSKYQIALKLMSDNPQLPNLITKESIKIIIKFIQNQQSVHL